MSVLVLGHVTAHLHIQHMRSLEKNTLLLVQSVGVAILNMIIFRKRLVVQDFGRVPRVKDFVQSEPAIPVFGPEAFPTLFKQLPVRRLLVRRQKKQDGDAVRTCMQTTLYI